jgi:RNA-directed DNA polymerase
LSTRRLPGLEILDLEGFYSVIEANSVTVKRVLQNKVNHYGRFDIPKWDGSPRTITPPREPIKDWQYSLKSYLSKKFTPAKAAHGGVRGCSTMTNAEPHVDQDVVLNLDIKGFFPNTRPSQIRKALEKLHARPEVAEVIADILTFEDKLPQGSPASVVMCNLLLLDLDHAIGGVCKARDFTYTRYIDDITVSGSNRIEDFRQKIKGFILDLGYSISEDRLTPRSECQVVTGLVVNEGLRPTSEFLDHLAAILKECINGSLIDVCTAEDCNPGQLVRSLQGQVNYANQFPASEARAKVFQGLLDRIKYSILPSLKNSN